MEIVLSADRIKECENYTIQEIGIPDIVLMEKAALFSTNALIKEINEDFPICVICGTGNNGADGLCIARMLIKKGYSVSLLIVEGSHRSPLFSIQEKILYRTNEVSKGHFKIVNEVIDNSIIIDAIFGIGLNKQLSKEMNVLIENINSKAKYIYSIDVPSGLNASTGLAMPIAVRANKVFTFGALKTGFFLNQGPLYYDHIECDDIGFEITKQSSDYSMLAKTDIKYYYDAGSFNAHKGTYGKVLFIAGSENIYGAAALAVKAAINAGCGMTKIITHINNKYSFEHNFPETMSYFYSDIYDKTQIEESLEWADTIVIGPGLSTKSIAVDISDTVLSSERLFDKFLVCDADFLNIIAKASGLFDKFINASRSNSICITPHDAEFKRLKNIIKDNLQDYLIDNGITILNKGPYSRIYGKNQYINPTGNDGMATAGSGDVLSGIIGGISKRVSDTDMSLIVAVATYIHGMCGDNAAIKKGKISISASDICNEIPNTIRMLIS